MNNLLYKVTSVRKDIHTQDGSILNILHDVTCEIHRGESIAIIGASGSGKSTLLHLLGLLDNPTSGSIEYNGSQTELLTREERAILHRKEIGFVFQFHHLLPEFTVVENVALHAQLAGYNVGEATKLAQRALEQVGLVHKTADKVITLSGGEKQRVSIARAIVTSPSVILADEPTGSLDAVSAEQVTSVLSILQEQHQTSLIVVTHNMELASRMQRCFILERGGLRDA